MVSKKIELKFQTSSPYCLEVLYPDGKTLRYYCPADQDINLPIESGCFMRFGLVPLETIDLSEEIEEAIHPNAK